MIYCFRDHITSAPTITPVWSAKFNILFAAERYAARTAVTAFNIYLRFVEKFHHLLPNGTFSIGHNKNGEWLAIPPGPNINAGPSYAGGTTETLVRLRVL